MIVDGQQRLIALYQACYSDRPARAVLDQSDAYRLYFFDIRKAIDRELAQRCGYVLGGGCRWKAIGWQP